jgi:hypothetical protein
MGKQTHAETTGLGTERVETEPENESNGRFFGYGALKAVGRLILSWILGSVLVALVVYAAGLSLAAFTTAAQLTMLGVAILFVYLALRNKTRF